MSTLTKSLHGTYLQEKYNEDCFGFCNERVHTNPFEWEVVSSHDLHSILGIKRYVDSSLDIKRPEEFWIVQYSFQVSALHKSREFLERIIKEAQDVYVLST